MGKRLEKSLRKEGSSDAEGQVEAKARISAGSIEAGEVKKVKEVMVLFWEVWVYCLSMFQMVCGERVRVIDEEREVVLFSTKNDRRVDRFDCPNGHQALVSSFMSFHGHLPLARPGK